MIQIAVERMAGKELVVRAKQFINEIDVRFKELEKDYEALEKEYKGLKEKYEDLKQEESEFPKAYDLGYEEGFVKGEQSMQEKAKKIVDFWDEADDEEIEDVFSDMEYGSAFENINESYDKIIEYEKKEQYEREIHIGDVVTKDGNNYVVFGFYGDDKNTLDLITKHGVMASLHKDPVTKTGKHYPIDEMLKELGQ